MKHFCASVNLNCPRFNFDMTFYEASETFLSIERTLCQPAGAATMALLAGGVLISQS